MVFGFFHGSQTTINGLVFTHQLVFFMNSPRICSCESRVTPHGFPRPQLYSLTMHNILPRPRTSALLQMNYPQVTPAMVRSRTAEIALNAGRSSLEINQRDYEQAKRELTGETDFDLQQAILYPSREDHTKELERLLPSAP